MIEFLPKNTEYQEPITICSNDINNFEHAIFMKQLHEIENLKPFSMVHNKEVFFIEDKEENQDKRIYEIYFDDSLSKPIGFYDLKDINYENHSVCYEMNFLKDVNLPENLDLNKLDFHFKEKNISYISKTDVENLKKEFIDLSYSLWFGTKVIKSNLFEYYISKKMVLDQKSE